MIGPSLGDLDAFVAVARARSFREAARLRGVSASTLSEALRRLEARLGVRLLNRTTRSVTPTEAGRQLLERIGSALGEIGAALESVGGGDGIRGRLRLNAPVIVARQILPALAARFLALHPGIAMEVEASDSFIDVLAAGFDAGIRYEERVERDMVAVPIGPRAQRYVCAAAPAYLAARGVPEHPHDVLSHACIRHRFASGVTVPWEFERGSETLRIVPDGPLVASLIELELEAAVAGLGLIFTFEDFLRPALDAGLLAPVLEAWWPSFSGPRLYYPGGRLMPAPLRAFVDFVKADGRGR